MTSTNDDSVLKQIIIWLIPCVLAITLHECAHGWMALRFGDTTARDRGRLSINPIRHVDLVGTFIVPGLMLLAHMPFVFGWAKPVPVDFQRLKHGRLGVFLVAIAGPLANLLMMFGWLAIAWLIGSMAETPNASSLSLELFAEIAVAGAAINLVLMLFNLIPIPPLDGGRVVGAILPDFLLRPYMQLERVGILILLIFIATGAFNIVSPLVDYFLSHLGLLH